MLNQQFLISFPAPDTEIAVVLSNFNPSKFTPLVHVIKASLITASSPLAGLATLVCYFFAFAVTLFYCKQYARLPFDYKSIAKILIASIIMGIFVTFANPTGIINILIVVGVAVVIYFVVLLLLKGIDKKEINLIKGMI